MIRLIRPKPLDPCTLHAAVISTVTQRRQAYSDIARKKLRPRFDGYRVLVVEDNEVNQQITDEMLTASGIEVDTANNGRTALEKLFSDGPKAYDLVLMDIQMSELSGYSVTRRIRMNPLFKNLPIIAMTAHATAEERAECLRSGMQDYIAKPIDPDCLYETLSRWLAQDPLSAGSRSASVDSETACMPASHINPVQIRGLNTEETLDRLGGDVQLYHRVLKTLVPSLSQALALYDTALVGHDYAAAKSAVHSVRGMAANVGAVKLMELARELEQALKDNQAAQVQIENFRALLVETLHAVEQGVAELIKAMTPS